MFRMSKETEEKLGTSPLKRSRADFKARRQKVYSFILKNPGSHTNKELAEAAGFDMSCSLSDSYQRGAQFIIRMRNGGHIDSQDDRDEPDKKLWYVTTKEKVDCSLFSPAKVIEEKHEEKESEGTREVVLDNVDKPSINDDTLYCFKFTVSKSGKLFESVDIELDDLSEEVILDKVKKAIKLL